MAGERLPARFLPHSQHWFRWTGKRFETATSHMQTVSAIELKKQLSELHALKEIFYFYIQ
jgi:hypothetical protein